MAQETFIQKAKEVEHLFGTEIDHFEDGYEKLNKVIRMYEKEVRV